MYHWMVYDDSEGRWFIPVDSATGKAYNTVRLNAEAFIRVWRPGVVFQLVPEPPKFELVKDASRIEAKTDAEVLMRARIQMATVATADDGVLQIGTGAREDVWGVDLSEFGISSGQEADDIAREVRACIQRHLGL